MKISAYVSEVRFSNNELVVQYKEQINRATPLSPKPNRLRLLNINSTSSNERILNSEANIILIEKENIIEELNDYRNNPNVLFAEPNYQYKLYSNSAIKVLPNDPMYNSQWHLESIEFDKAWALSKPIEEKSEVIIGIIDSEFDTQHPDLKNQFWVNPNEIPGNRIDDDYNNYIDDIYGYDFGSNSYELGAPSQIADFHGTHVSGISLAAVNNNIGILGVQPFAKLIACKVTNNEAFLDSEGNVTISASAIYDALNYLTSLKNNGSNIVAVNASFGGPGYSQLMYNAIEDMNNAGIILCTAAGNDGIDTDLNNDNYPNNYDLPNIISVAASSINGSLASYSNYGESNVDIIAPGTAINSSLPITKKNELKEIKLSNNNIYIPNIIKHSGLTPSSGITGSIIECGIGLEDEFPLNVSGNIALIERGSTFFSEKVRNAMAAGARAVIIYNNIIEPLPSLSHVSYGSPEWIPSLIISKSEGEAIISQLPISATIKYLYEISDSSYGSLQGTSMAAPIISAAVAFSAHNFPNDTIIERKVRVLNAVDKKDQFLTKIKSGGTINLRKIVDLNGDRIPDWVVNPDTYIEPKIKNFNINEESMKFNFMGHENENFKIYKKGSILETSWEEILDVNGEGYMMSVELERNDIGREFILLESYND